MARTASVALLAFLMLVPTAAAAAGRPVFSLRAVGNPKLGYFVYHLAPGAARSGAVIVSNTGTAAGTVKLYAADGATGSTSGTVYLTDKPPAHTARWVDFARSTLDLRPGEHVRVPFRVHVPADAPPGQWVAGLVAESARRAPTPRTSKRAGIRIRIRDLTIVAVQVDVPGPARPQFSIGGAHVGGQKGFEQLLVRMRNGGNVLRKPTGRVVISRRSGAVVESLPFEMDTFLPKTAIDYPLLLKHALEPGRYVAAVTLTFAGADGAPTTVRSSPPFSISRRQVKQIFASAPPTRRAAGASSSTPWLLIVAIVVASVVAALLALIVILLLRRPGQPPRPETGTPDDSVR
jgi:hypothetical protein